jgi:hypothetical protein
MNRRALKVRGHAVTCPRFSMLKAHVYEPSQVQFIPGYRTVTVTGTV